MIFFKTSIGALLLTIFIIAIVAILFILQGIKLNKKEALLKEQDKKLQEMINKQNEKNKYDDFTDGHLYQ